MPGFRDCGWCAATRCRGVLRAADSACSIAKHRSDADSRGDQDHRIAVVGEIEVAARSGGFDDRSRFDVGVQPSAHHAVVFTLDADAVVAAARGRPRASSCAAAPARRHREFAPSGTDPEAAVAAARGRRPRSRIDNTCRAFPAYCADPQAAKSVPPRFDSDRRCRLRPRRSSCAASMSWNDCCQPGLSAGTSTILRSCSMLRFGRYSSASTSATLSS